MAGIRHRHTATGADDPEAEVNAAEWNATHLIETLDLVGQTSDPSPLTDGMIWYRSDLNSIFAREAGVTIDLGAPAWSQITDKPQTLPALGIMDGTRRQITTATTVALSDYMRHITCAATLSLTLPATPFTGFAFVVNANATSLVTLVPQGGNTVEPDSLVYPGEAVKLVFDGSVWRRRPFRGFGFRQSGALGYIPDQSLPSVPSGLYQITASTANPAKPSHMTATILAIYVESMDATRSRQTVWDPLRPQDGRWSRNYASGAWETTWQAQGASTQVSTANRPTNAAIGAIVFDTTLNRSITLTATGWVDATDRANHTGTQPFSILTGLPPTLAGHGIMDAVQIPHVAASTGFAILANTGVTGNQTQFSSVTSADFWVMYPFVPRGDINVASWSIRVYTAAAGGLGKFGVYGADQVTGRPTNLLLETGTVDLSVVAAPSVAGAVSLLKGRVYWIGFRSNNSTSAVGVYDYISTPDLFSPNANTGTPRKCVTRSIAFSSALPGNWAWNDGEITGSGTRAPAIHLVV